MPENALVEQEHVGAGTHQIEHDDDHHDGEHEQQHHQPGAAASAVLLLEEIHLRLLTQTLSRLRERK